MTAFATPETAANLGYKIGSIIQFHEARLEASHAPQASKRLFETSILNPAAEFPIMRSTHRKIFGESAKLDAMIADLGELPNSLTLDQQNCFWLGYYHSKKSNQQ